MRRLVSWIAVAASVLFFLMGQAFVPLLGIEDDEGLFGMALYQPLYTAFVRVWHLKVPLMLMTYLGTLKALLYWPILKCFHPGVWSLREPALAAGAASIWLFSLLLRRIAGERAALMGCILLAGDSVYLLTTTFDWGPVALQHLLTIAGMLLLVTFEQDGGNGKLAAAGFLLGLALWDKAIAVWMISGAGAAALAVCWREIRRVTTVRRVAIFGAALLMGTLPLWVYNATYNWATFRGNFQKDFSQIGAKGAFAVETLDANALFGYLTEEDLHTPSPHLPANLWQRASARLAAMTGNPRHGLGAYALALAILLTPLAAARERRAVLFATIAMTLAWFQMAITANAGGGVHHVVLLWPLPQLVMGVSLGAASRRFGRAGLVFASAVVFVAIAAGMLVTNQYYVEMSRNGGSSPWSDAIFPLHRYLADARPETVVSMDWGIMDNLRFLSAGKLALADGRIPDPAIMRLIAGNRGNVYVAHTKEQQFAPANDIFLKAAGELGFGRETVAVIDDSFGRHTYELYRLSPGSQ